MHAWENSFLPAWGWGSLIGVTLSMAAFIAAWWTMAGRCSATAALISGSATGHAGARYAESSSVNDDAYRGILAMPGIAQAANVTYLTTQVRKGERDVRAMVVGISPGKVGAIPGWPPYLVAGRQVTRGHYEALLVYQRLQPRRSDHHPPQPVPRRGPHTTHGVFQR